MAEESNEQPIVAWAKNTNSFYKKKRKPQIIKQKQIARKSRRIPHENAEFIPGLKNVTSSSLPIWYRIIWGVFLLTCCLTTSYQIATRIGIFVRNEKIFQTKIEMRNEVTFPSFTVCYMLDAGSPMMNAVFREFIAETKEDWQELDVFDLIGFKGLTVDDLWNLTIMDDYVSVLFLNGDMIFPKDLSVEKKMVSTVRGNCITVTIKNIVAYQEGRNLEAGLSFRVFKRLDNVQVGYLGFYWHSSEDTVHHTVYNKLAYYPSDVVTFTMLDWKTITFMNSTDDICLDEEDFRHCRDQCFDNRLLTTLKCSLPFMQPSHMERCSNASSAKEAYLDAEAIYKSDLPCKKLCHRKCVEKRIKAITFTYPSVNSTTSPHYFQIEDNIFETVNEIVFYDIVSFLSDVGGNLGLFLGISILQMLQILEFFAIVVWRKCNN